MNRPTKHCTLRVHLTTGECIAGDYHVDAVTSSTIRPSDALRSDASGYILLTNAVHADHADAEQPAVVLVNRNAVAMIEIPRSGWTADGAAMRGSCATSTAT
jgi:hypothetical protein